MTLRQKLGAVEVAGGWCVMADVWSLYSSDTQRSTRASRL